MDSVAAAVRDAGARFRQARGGLAARARDDRHAHADRRADRAQRLWRLFRRRAGADDHRGLWAARRRRPARDVRATHADPRDLRSEELTSEIQSLMSTTYADLCLKKKKLNNSTDTILIGLYYI